MTGFSTETSEAGKILTVHISGFFDNSIKSELTALGEEMKPPVEKCYVNLIKADYMDSMAISLLIQLKEATDIAGIELKVLTGTKGIKDIFRIMNLNQLFCRNNKHT